MKSKKESWFFVSIILGLILLISLYYNFRSTGNENEAANSVIEYIKTVSSVTPTLINTTEKNGLYVVSVNIEGRNYELYTTKDGKLMFPQVISLDLSQIPSQQTQELVQEIPKKDKPIADFYVFSYCPYGTQMEKALIPVYNLLKDKVDINIVFIGAMHGEYEKIESLRQLCIQENYGKDKLIVYLDKFLVNEAVGNCNGKDTCVNPLVESIYIQIDIDKFKIDSCMIADAEVLYQAHGKQAQGLGISGSPSTVINGVRSQVGRSPALIQEAICSAFNTPPAECSQVLSANAASPGFGSTASSGSTSSCG